MAYDVKLFLCGKEIKDIDNTKCKEHVDCRTCDEAIRERNESDILEAEKTLNRFLITFKKGDA